jgi:hypothetical protein
MTKLVITEIKSQQAIVNSCNEKSKDINETRNEAMLERTAWAVTVLKGFKPQGGQDFKASLLDATNQKTQEETVSFVNRILKKKLIDTEVLATFTADKDGKDNFRDWMAQEEISTWKNIVAYGKVEKVLSKLEQALLVAMLEVTREPEFEGIVDQENGEVDKVSDAISKVLFVIQTKVDADNPAN